MEVFNSPGANKNVQSSAILQRDKLYDLSQISNGDGNWNNQVLSFMLITSTADEQDDTVFADDDDGPSQSTTSSPPLPKPKPANPPPPPKPQPDSPPPPPPQPDNPPPPKPQPGKPSPPHKDSSSDRRTASEPKEGGILSSIFGSIFG